MNLLKNNSLWATVFSLFVVVMAFDLGTIASANRQSLEILRANANLMFNTLNAETGQRGFILTGDINYLVPYQTSKNESKDNIKALQKISAGGEDENQTNLLIWFTEQKQSEMESTIQAHKIGGSEAAVAIVKNNIGKNYMDQIRAIYTTIVTKHRQNLSIQLDKLDFRIKTAYYMLSLSFLLSILSTSIDGWIILKQSRQRDLNP